MYLGDNQNHVSAELSMGQGPETQPKKTKGKYYYCVNLAKLEANYGNYLAIIIFLGEF
jgi:hypothetical protein